MFAYAKPEQKQTSKDMIRKKEAEEVITSPNFTGIPDTMKSRFENLSGFSFDDVRVHYNSDKPAQLQALAYTQGDQVYVGPGQEKHLGHELGHVVQQKRGGIAPTTRLQNIKINDNSALEKESDKLAQIPVSTYESSRADANANISRKNRPAYNSNVQVVQRQINFSNTGITWNVESGGRASFNSDFQQVYPDQTPHSGLSKNHIFSAKSLRDMLSQVLSKSLQGKTSSHTQTGKSNDLSFEKDLRMITKIAIPSNNILLPASVAGSTVNAGAAPAIINKQRIHALNCCQKLNQIISGNPVNVDDLKAYADSLDETLTNSVANVRIGYSSPNSSIGEKIDPLTGTASFVSGGVSDTLSVDSSIDAQAGFAKKMHKLLALKKRGNVSGTAGIEGFAVKMTHGPDSFTRSADKLLTSDLNEGTGLTNTDKAIDLHIRHKKKWDSLPSILHRKIGRLQSEIAKLSATPQPTAIPHTPYGSIPLAFLMPSLFQSNKERLEQLYSQLTSCQSIQTQLMAHFQASINGSVQSFYATLDAAQQNTINGLLIETQTAISTAPSLIGGSKIITPS